MAQNFIAGAIKKPGQLHRDLGVPQGQKIPAGQIAAAAKRPGKVGQRARFAQTLKHMNSNDAFHSGPVTKAAKHGANPQSTNQTPHQAQARHSVAQKKGLHARVRAGLKKAFPVSAKDTAARTPITKPELYPVAE